MTPRKTITGLVAATTLALSATAFSTPAQAWHGHGFGFGFGAAALGAAAIASSYDGPYVNCTYVDRFNRAGRYIGTVKRCW
jgi:hypothetical protein